MTKLDVKNLLASKIKAQRLAILVFGPAPHIAGDPSASSHKLALKRIEIRDKLRAEGHIAEFPEDLLVGTNKPPKGMLLRYEEVLASTHDLVVMLVESPGSNNEIGYFAAKTDLAQKTQAFIDKRYIGGLAEDTCHSLIDLGGEFEHYQYPDDLDHCHLWGAIKKLVEILQRRKLYS